MKVAKTIGPFAPFGFYYCSSSKSEPASSGYSLLISPDGTEEEIYFNGKWNLYFKLFFIIIFSLGKTAVWSAANQLKKAFSFDFLIQQVGGNFKNI